MVKASMQSRGTTRTAFVFAGGGSLGAVEVGMLQALVARGVIPDMVVGASVGAINAFLFASDPTRDGVNRLAQIWSGLTDASIFPRSALRAFLAVVGRRDSLLDPAPLRRLLTTHAPVRYLEDTVLPCIVTATDAMDGEEVLLDSGNAVDALVASSALPALFPPVHRDGKYLMDGGLASNAPVSAAIARGASRVIVLPTGFSCAMHHPPGPAIGMILHAFTLLVVRQLGHDIERLRATAEILVVPPLCPIPIASYDFSRTPELIDRARASTESWLDAGGLTRPGDDVPLSLRPHTHGSER